MKAEIQKEQRKASLEYIEKLICDLTINEPDIQAQNHSKYKKLFNTSSQ